MRVTGQQRDKSSAQGCPIVVRTALRASLRGSERLDQLRCAFDPDGWRRAFRSLRARHCLESRHVRHMSRDICDTCGQPVARDPGHRLARLASAGAAARLRRSCSLVDAIQAAIRARESNPSLFMMPRGREQVVAPLDCHAQRLVARQRRAGRGELCPKLASSRRRPMRLVA